MLKHPFNTQLYLPEKIAIFTMHQQKLIYGVVEDRYWISEDPEFPLSSCSDLGVLLNYLQRLHSKYI